jgi:hypothetical protein
MKIDHITIRALLTLRHPISCRFKVLRKAETKSRRTRARAARDSRAAEIRVELHNDDTVRFRIGVQKDQGIITTIREERCRRFLGRRRTQCVPYERIALAQEKEN